MQKYIHYKKWTGLITGHSREKSDCCIKVDVPNDIDNYMVFDGKLCKRDNIVRLPLEKKLSNIEYGKKATVKLNIFPDDAIIKVVIDKYFIQTFIDPYQLDRIQFTEPILKIYVHSKKTPELFGTLEIDLNEYIRTEKYEKNIPNILRRINIENLIFKTYKSFESYAYEIFKKSKITDRNLLDNDHHIKIYIKNKQLLIQSNIKYWEELEDILHYRFIISFFNKNRNYLEYYVPFVLNQFSTVTPNIMPDGYYAVKETINEQHIILIDLPLTVDLTNTKIHINSNKLKIKYENTNN